MNGTASKENYRYRNTLSIPDALRIWTEETVLARAGRGRDPSGGAGPRRCGGAGSLRGRGSECGGKGAGMADARGQAGADAGAGSGGGLVPAELKHAALNRSAAFVPDRKSVV